MATSASARGRQGKPGRQGKEGKPGKAGPRGQRGEQGMRGPAGPAVTRVQILEAVQREFDDMRREVRVQVERLAQIQLQLDAIHKLLRDSIQKI